MTRQGPAFGFDDDDDEATTVDATAGLAFEEREALVQRIHSALEETLPTGTPLPAWVRRDEGLGTVEDVAELIVYLASDAAKGVTGQAIGIGGDRLALWSHPAEKQVEFADGGWTADEIAQKLPSFAPETYGIPAPVAP